MGKLEKVSLLLLLQYVSGELNKLYMDLIASDEPTLPVSGPHSIFKDLMFSFRTGDQLEPLTRKQANSYRYYIV